MRVQRVLARAQPAVVVAVRRAPRLALPVRMDEAPFEQVADVVAVFAPVAWALSVAPAQKEEAKTMLEEDDDFAVHLEGVEGEVLEGVEGEVLEPAGKVPSLEAETKPLSRLDIEPSVVRLGRGLRLRVSTLYCFLRFISSSSIVKL